MIRYQVKNQCTINVSYISNDIVHKSLSIFQKKPHFYLFQRRQSILMSMGNVDDIRVYSRFVLICIFMITEIYPKLYISLKLSG